MPRAPFGGPSFRFVRNLFPNVRTSGTLARLVSGTGTLALVALLAACGTDSAAPISDPVRQGALLSPTASLLYPDEAMDVRVRFTRARGGAAANLPVTVTGPGSWAGPRLTDALGELRGTWTPGAAGDGSGGAASGNADGTATLTLEAEGRTVTVETRVVSRTVTELVVSAPAFTRAGDPFDLRVEALDGKGLAPGPDYRGDVTLIVDGDPDDAASSSTSASSPQALTEGGAAFPLTLTTAGARLFRVEHSAGPQVEGAILVRSGSPAELVLEAPATGVSSGASGGTGGAHGSPSAFGRENDEALVLPTLAARDVFGNPLEGEYAVVAGGGGTVDPGVLTFSASGRATPERWLLGSGSEAGHLRVLDDEGQAEATAPVLPRRTPVAVIPEGLDPVIFTGSLLNLAFRADGEGGPVAFGVYRIFLSGDLRAEGRLDAAGNSGTVTLGELDAGAAQLRVEVDGENFDFDLEVRTPPTPDNLRILAGDAQAALAGSTLAPLRIEVRDQRGEPLQLPLGWKATGGSVQGAGVSAADGTAQAIWTLPGEPGSYEVTVTAGPLEVTFTATALEAPTPASVEIVAGNDQAGLGGKPFAESLRIRVRDQFGAPIGGVVTWTGEGSFAPASTALSTSGEAATTWTPPAGAGTWTATASVGGVSAAFRGTVTAPALPWRLERLSGDAQEAAPGTELPEPLRVRITDQDGDPFQGSVTFLGDGSFAPASVEAGPDGLAETRWTLPATVGSHVARAATSQDTVSFGASAVLPHPLAIDGHYLVQTIQTEAHEMELVAGRAALFRGFLQRMAPGDFEVRLRVQGSGSTVETLAVTSAAAPPSGTPDRMDPSTSFQVIVPAHLVVPGMSYTLEVESASGLLSAGRSPTVVPRSPLNVTFVPVRVDSTGAVGNVTPANMGDFLGRAEALPFPSVNGSVRAEYVYGGSPVTGSGSTWSPLLSEIRELRMADGNPDLYYGVVPREGSSGVAGIGYIGYPVSLGLRGNANLTQYIFNHEIGHNLSLRHAPCGISGGTDPDFPYSDGRIGAHGYLQGAVLDPTTSDTMGYCGGFTFGTYHWSKAINYTVPTLATSFAASVAASMQGHASQGASGPSSREPAFRIWGSVVEGEVKMRAPYVGGGDDTPGTSGPALAPAPGTSPAGSRVEITVRAPGGELLWSGSARLLEMDHADGGSFSLGIPVTALGEDRQGLEVEARVAGRISRFTWGRVDAPAPGARPLPAAEVYRTPAGAVVGFGVEGETRAPAGTLVQDGTLRGQLWSVDAAGERVGVVGRARDLLRR
jgi:hypothetical protein